MEAGFSSYHPFVIFTYYVCVAILTMYFNHPLFLCIGLMLLIIVNGTHDHAQSLKKWTKPLLFMGLLFILLNALFVSRGSNILFYFLGKQITLEATMYGIVTALSLVMIIILFVSFNLILNGNKFLFIFSTVLPRTGFLVMLSIRFIPLLRRRLQEVNEVQRVRGLALSEGSLRMRVRNGMIQLQILLTWSLEEAIQTADSMKARGYGSGKKTLYTPFLMEKRDWIWLFTLLLLFTLCIIGGFLGYGKIIIYPQLGTLQMYPIDWMLFCSMIILYSFPLMVESREVLRWKYLH